MHYSGPQGSERSLLWQKKTDGDQEKVWKALKEITSVQKEFQKGQIELRKAQQKTEAGFKEVQKAQKKTEAGFKEVQEAQKKTEKSLGEFRKSVNESIGYNNSRWGILIEKFAESGSLDALKKQNIDVNRVYTNLCAKRSDNSVQAEFDLVAVDGKLAIPFEAKTVLFCKDVDSFIEKLKKFRKYFSEYSDYVIYGGVAYLELAKGEHSNPSTYASEQGLFVMKIPGDISGVTEIVNPKKFSPKKF